jgi:hypothetical protein
MLPLAGRVHMEGDIYGAFGYVLRSPPEKLRQEISAENEISAEKAAHEMVLCELCVNGEIPV